MVPAKVILQLSRDCPNSLSTMKLWRFAPQIRDRPHTGTVPDLLTLTLKPVSCRARMAL